MCHESFLDIALEDIHSEMIRGVPVRSQKTLDQALADAEMAMKTLQSGFARKGGRPTRCDALQSLLEEIVDENPRIKLGKLRAELDSDRGAGTITSIDEDADIKADEPRMIHFVDDDETPRTAPLSGLKDRLYRAKIKLASR
jgi:hypothetical protein